MRFNKEQRQAIEHGEGPMIVVAGPGSGKTTVLTYRVKHLLEKGEVRPENILVITFTKAAATEMKLRFDALMGESIPVTFGTFHSVFFRILRAAYGYSVDNIIKEDFRRQILMEAVTKCHMEPEDGTDFLNQLAGEISRVKSEGLDICAYHSAVYPSQNFQDVYRYYTRALQRLKLVDFDDMLLQCRDLLRKRPDILAGWQRRYSYILIDEFQDINAIQYEVVRMLAHPQDNLFVVGDDDQSIYGFRGSKPEIMLRFEGDYPETRKIVLDTNFRSTENIVKAAGLVIGNNHVRYAKNIHTANAPGNTVSIIELPNVQEEYERVVNLVRESVNSGEHAYKDFAVLFRTNSVAEPLVRKLMEYNLPFVLKEGMPNIFDHWIAKDFIAYLTLALGGRSRADFLRIANKPLRYIGRDYLTDAEIDLEELEKYYEEKPWMAERIHKLSSDLKWMSGMSAYAALNFIRKGVGYDDYLTTYAADHELDKNELLSIAEELQDTTKGIKSIADWFDWIGDYTRELKETNRKKLGQEDADALTLTTMHSSKGLEFDTVIIIDANEEICPHKRSVFPEQIEEERRMFYVAMTRAKKQLHILYARSRYNHKLEPSRFVTEIMEQPK